MSLSTIRASSNDVQLFCCHPGGHPVVRIHSLYILNNITTSAQLRYRYFVYCLLVLEKKSQQNVCNITLLSLLLLWHSIHSSFPQHQYRYKYAHLSFGCFAYTLLCSCGMCSICHDDCTLFFNTFLKGLIQLLNISFFMLHLAGLPCPICTSLPI